MSQIHECPADGCDYSGVKSSVLGHYSGKQDDAHSGGYADAKHILEQAEQGGQQGGQEQADKSPDGSSTAGGATTPSFPAADGGGSTAGSGRPECPNCGRSKDVYTADSVLTLYEQHEGITVGQEHRQRLTEAEAGCVGCGTAFTPEGSQ